MSLQSMLEETVDRSTGGLEFGLPLELKILDREVIDALLTYPEGPPRDEFALRALRIGVLALKQAQGQIDTQAVRQEGERLLRNVEAALGDHQKLLNERLTAQLKMYFDPQDGRFHERVERLIRQDGELEQLLRRNIGDDDSRLCQTLTQHIGDGSPLMRVLDPEAGDGLTAALRKCVEERLADQRKKVLDEFSLDKDDSALSRFLKQVQLHYDGVSGNLTEKIDKVVAEFSLDKEESALNRLVGRVTEAQQMITREFTLDQEESALSRLRGELVKLLKDQTEGNRTFQEEVKVAIGELKARKEEAARSTRHGITFEESFLAAIQSEVRNTDDVVEHVGGHSGVISRCNVGDVLVTLGPESAASGVRIVFEAKEKKDYSLANALAELDVARKNREAQIGVFVFSSKCVPVGCDVFRRYGSNIVIVWDSEDPGTDIYVRVALTLAKALCVSEKRRSSAEVADLVAMETGILQIEGRMKDLDQISKSATTIQNGAEKILDSERRLRKTIVEQIENLRDRINDLRNVVGGSAGSEPAA